MSEAETIDCSSAENVGALPEVARLIAGRRPFLLRFPGLSEEDAGQVLMMLKPQFPDYSVFRAFFPGPLLVNCVPVVAEADAAPRGDLLSRAVQAYRSTCTELVSRWRAGALSGDWVADEHGEHCRFENIASGQIVDAPIFDLRGSQRVDPYFFGEFVRSTPGFEEIAALIRHSFHDSARLLDSIGE